MEALTPLPDDIESDELRTSGYVVTTLHIALYYGLTAESVEDAIVAAVNMGGDRATIGTIAGAVADARYVSASIPDRWVTTLRSPDATELEAMAESLIMRDIAPVVDSGDGEVAR